MTTREQVREFVAASNGVTRQQIMVQFRETNIGSLRSAISKLESYGEIAKTPLGLLVATGKRFPSERRSPYKPLNQTIKERIIALWQSPYSGKQIAARYGITRGQVNYIWQRCRMRLRFGYRSWHRLASEIPDIAEMDNWQPT